jgi:hypothetical protein
MSKTPKFRRIRDGMIAAVAAVGVTSLVAGAVVLGTASAAQGADEDVPCGTPAQEAVYETIHHPAQEAVYETVVVPEQTLTEWAVESPGEGWVKGESRFVETAPGSPEVPEEYYWEYEYAKTVVVEEAVYETLYEFKHRNGNTRWESDPNWNSNNNDSSNGWTATGNTMPGELITPAVEETVHEWFAQNPGDPWEPTGEKRKVVTQEYVPGTEPEGYYEYLWTKVVPASTEERLVTPAKEAWTEEKLVSPAVPAGPPCPEEPVVEEPVVEEPVVKPIEAEVEVPADKKAQSDKKAQPDEVLAAEAVPTAVAAGLGAPGPVSSTGGLLGQGLVAAGLFMVLLAGSAQMGRRRRGAHEV